MKKRTRSSCRPSRPPNPKTPSRGMSMRSSRSPFSWNGWAQPRLSGTHPGHRIGHGMRTAGKPGRPRVQADRPAGVSRRNPPRRCAGCGQDQPARRGRSGPSAPARLHRHPTTTRPTLGCRTDDVLLDQMLAEHAFTRRYTLELTGAGAWFQWGRACCERQRPSQPIAIGPLYNLAVHTYNQGVRANSRRRRATRRHRFRP